MCQSELFERTALSLGGKAGAGRVGSGLRRAFQKQMILARSDVKRRWHLVVHHGSLKCVRVSLAPKAYRTVRGRRPRPEWGLPLLALSEFQRGSHYYNSSPCGRHIGRRILSEGRSL